MPFLDWVNKNQARASSTQVPYHLLQKEAEYGAPSENMVIQGDNLLALRALMRQVHLYRPTLQYPISL